MITKIAFVYCELVLGGSEKVGYDTAQYLRRWGVESHFFACRLNEHARVSLEEAGISCHLLPCDNPHELGAPDNLESMRTQFEHLGIQLAVFMAWNYQVARDLKQLFPVKTLLWHHMNPLQDTENKLHRTRARARRSIWAWLEYHLLAKMKYRYLPFKRHEWLQSYREAIAVADYYAVLCPQYVEDLRKKLSLNAEEAERIISMINTYPKVEAPQLDKQKEIVYVGRLDRGQKQVDLLLRVWQRVQTRLDGWTLRIYGSGKDADYLKSYAQKLGLERCHFMGCIQYPEEVYRSASILCLTSGFEGFPLVLVEAQSHGVVPIAFNCCAGVEYIIGENNKAGILVPQYDVKSFADELVALCGDEMRLGALRLACLDKCQDYAPEINDAEWRRILELDNQ